MRYKQALYQDWKDRKINRNDYQHMSGGYEWQAEAIRTVISNLQVKQEDI